MPNATRICGVRHPDALGQPVVDQDRGIHIPVLFFALVGGYAQPFLAVTLTTPLVAQIEAGSDAGVLNAARSPHCMGALQ